MPYGSGVPLSMGGLNKATKIWTAGCSPYFHLPGQPSWGFPDVGRSVPRGFALVVWWVGVPFLHYN